jgi:hypothetical protein
MIASGAELHEFEPLEQLSKTLLRAPVAIGKSMAEADDELSPRLRRIERAVEAARVALTRAEAYLEEVRSRSSSDEDEDSSDFAEEAVEEARHRLDAMKCAADDVRDALSRYKIAARELVRAGEAQFPEGARFLIEQVALARAYRSVELESPSPSGRTPARASALPAALSDAPEVKLPKGFFWLPLRDVTPVDRLSDPADWKKVSKSDMEAGVRVLYEELIPLLASRPDLTREDCVEIDRKLGRVDPTGLVHPRSLTLIHEVFFSGSEPVCAELHSDGRWHVNGRHRVSIAAELGQTHIPAKRQGLA